MGTAFELCQEFKGKKACVLMNQQHLFRHHSPSFALCPEQSVPWQMKIPAGHPLTSVMLMFWGPALQVRT